MAKQGVINIHGKQYKTVANRVNEFRSMHPDWTIKTKLVSDTAEDSVVMKASILNHEGRLIATGYAEEVRGSTNINRTSALENCETSAIGRALAAFGLAGEEYASANEVENAIHQQKQMDTVAEDHIAKMQECTDLVSLSNAFTDAYNYARSINDKAMAGRFEKAKDNMKAKLGDI